MDISVNNPYVVDHAYNSPYPSIDSPIYIRKLRRNQSNWLTASHRRESAAMAAETGIGTID
jgi:hypothetical protein